MKLIVAMFTSLVSLHMGKAQSQDFFPLAPGNFWIYNTLEAGQITGQFGYLVNDTFTFDGLLLYDVSFLLPDSNGIISDTLLGPLLFDHPSNPIEIHQYVNEDSSRIFAFHSFSTGTFVQPFPSQQPGEVIEAGDVSTPAGDFKDCIQVVDGETNSGLVYAPDVGLIKIFNLGADVAVLAAYQVMPSCASTATASISHVSCFEGDDGRISVDIMEGTPPFSFEWSGPVTIGNEQNPTGLKSGNYEVTITDDDGCISVLTDLNISEPQAIAISIDNIRNVSCAGLSDGAISVSATGGTPEYMYSWDAASGVPDPVGLSAGLYNLTVTDANICTTTVSVTIVQPDPLQANITTMDESAFGSEDGTAEANPSGGTAPYNFLWSNASVEQQLENLAPGPYAVTVEDANGCTVTDIVTIDAFQCSLGASVEVDDPLCAGDSGLVTLMVTGDNPPVDIIWSSGLPDQTSQVLSAGIYSVVVSDSRFCALVVDFEVEEPEPVSILIDSIGHDLGNREGFIFTTVSGGTPPYTFSWSDESGPVSTEEDPGGLEAGSYSLTVTDANNCLSSIESIVVESSVAILRIGPGGDLVFYPNPTPDILYWKLDSPLSPGTLLEIFDIHGRKILQSDMSEGKIDLNSIEAGWYLLKCHLLGQILNGQILKSQ